MTRSISRQETMNLLATFAVITVIGITLFFEFILFLPFSDTAKFIVAMVFGFLAGPDIAQRLFMGKLIPGSNRKSIEFFLVQFTMLMAYTTSVVALYHEKEILMLFAIPLAMLLYLGVTYARKKKIPIFIPVFAMVVEFAIVSLPIMYFVNKLFI